MAEHSATSEKRRESLRTAARTALLMNGTAAFILLVFLAHLYGLAQTRKVPVSDFMMDLADAFYALLAGILLVAIHHVVDYFAVAFEGGAVSRSFGAWAALVCIVASYFCFAFGAYTTHAAFLDYLPVS